MPSNSSAHHPPVLLVDDDEDQLVIRSLLLRRHGFATITAKDGASALQAAEAQMLYCAIVDLRLPTEMQGIQLIRQLKDVNAHLHIIILTGADPTRLNKYPEACLVDRVFAKGSPSAPLLEYLQFL